MADKTDTVSPFARAHSQNSKASLDAELRALNETIDKSVLALRALMQRRTDIEFGLRVMYGVSPEREAGDPPDPPKSPAMGA